MLTPQKGEVIAERYHLERELARGGMGSVWAGHDAKLRRKVAVKLVAPDWSSGSGDAEARERFEREAMAVAQLQSPHVVQVFDFGVERGFPYIVMELLEGEDLRTRLHNIKRVSLETAAHILVQTAKALSVAHASGVIHRDLKPGNIFLVRAGEEELVKILDFGVAKSNDQNLLEGADDEEVLGTPQFMSPEQARGLQVDHRADLWSLAVIIYKALTGRLPFQGRTPTSVIVKVCTTDAQPVSELAPDLPRELDAFFQRALARERENRFSSAREMALAFSRITPITFTTLSMPDPKKIEAAIAAAQAQAAAADDEDVPTMAMDLDAALETMAIGEDEIFDDNDQRTSVHIPPQGLRATPKIKPPTPPPRRSRSGAAPDTLRAGAPRDMALKPSEEPPPSSAKPPPTPVRPRPAAGRAVSRVSTLRPLGLPLPRSPKGSSPSLRALAVAAPISEAPSSAPPSSREIAIPVPEPSEPSSPTLDNEPAPTSGAVPSAPMLLSRPSLGGLPTPPISTRGTPPPLPSRPSAQAAPSADASGSHVSSLALLLDDEAETPPPPPLHPSTPMVESFDSHISTAPPPRGTRPTLLLALLAVVAGVAVAWIANAVLQNDRTPVADAGEPTVAAPAQPTHEPVAAPVSAAPPEPVSPPPVEPTADTPETSAPVAVVKPSIPGPRQPPLSLPKPLSKTTPPAPEPPPVTPPPKPVQTDPPDPFAERL